MEQSIPSSQNQLACQTKRIRSQELKPTALQVRKRAIAARAGTLRSIQASSYNHGGWRSLFEEYVPQPFGSNAIGQNPESDRAIANSPPSVLSSYLFRCIRDSATFIKRGKAFQTAVTATLQVMENVILVTECHWAKSRKRSRDRQFTTVCAE